MKESPLISVIMVNYNGLSDIDSCLNSVLKQSYSNYEVVFVDNASTDDSLAYTRKKYPDIKFVINNSNLGYAGGINSAVQNTKGEYLAPLNLDTEVDFHWLSSMMDFVKKHPDAGAVTPKILLFTRRDRVNTMGLDIHVSGLAFCRNLGKSENMLREPHEVSGISGCSYLIEKKTFVSIGGIPEENFMANDDTYLSWLITLMGYKIYCVPESVVYHKYHIDLTPDKLYNLEKNRYFLLSYGYKPLTFWLLSPFLFFIELLTIIFAIIKGSKYIRAKYSAIYDFWKQKEIIKKRRKQYYPFRKISDRCLLKKLKWIIKPGQMFNPI